jgi:cytochrome c-type biogenesis protein CcmH
VSRVSGNPLAVKLAGAAALCVPLLTLGYYYVSSYRGETGEWLALQQQMDEAVTRAMRRPDELPELARADLIGFTRVLQARLLEAGMRDPDGLYLLGNAYLQLRQLPAALTALGRAFELNPQRPDIMLAYAQAMILTQDERLSRAGIGLLHTVLQINPNHQGALMLLGFGSFNAGAYEEAIQVWQRLLALRAPDSEGAQLLRNSIARAEQLLAPEPAPAPAPAAAPATGPRIAVTVDLAPALRARLTEQDTLFIFARAANGPPMPLAAVRQPVQGFPIQVTLDDSQAVTPSLKLSNFQQVVVGARISKAGSVTAQSGDLQGVTATLSLQNGLQAVSLIIDQVVQ